MAKNGLFQSAPDRAWQDTWRWLLDYKVGFIIGIVVLGGASGLFIGDNVLWRVLTGVVGAIIGVIILIGMTFIIVLLITPYRQRNEARAFLSEGPIPIPLQNRKELVEAIATVEATTMKLVNLQNEVEDASKYPNNSERLIDATIRRDEAYANWNESMNLLRRQYLVAGDPYETICIDFTGFVGTQVWIKMSHAQIISVEPTKPSILEDTLQFAGQLAGRVKQTIQKINEINGRVPHTEGSQP